MNKGELVVSVAEQTGMAKGDVEKVLASILETIKSAMSKDDTVQLIGFGSFSVSVRNEREGYNPHTKEKTIIPASKTVKFKPGTALKEAVN